MSQDFETFTESGVEADFLKWLSDDGWEVYGEGDKWGSEILDNRYGRDRNEVIYWDILKEKVIELNDHITEDNIERFLSSLKRDLSHENLIQANKNFHKILRGGKRGFQYQAEDGSQKTKAVDLIDFQDTDNNRFIAVNQFRVRQGNGTKRPDINLFVNGIPLVTMELKSVTQENDYYDAIEDIQEYEEDISRLFVPALFNVASDSMEFRYGSVNATNEFYNPWKPDENTGGIPVKQAVEDLLTQEKLLDILHNFVFFEEKAGGDAKITPRHMQYQASNRILERINTEESNRGLIWHTQGSGKSYTMLYTAKNLITRDILDNPQIVVLVDREKLESQMSNTLDSIDFDQYDIAKSGEHLQDLLQNGTSTLILTTIQKFQTVENDSQGNPETVVLTDEAHRFMEKDLGSKLDAVLPETYHFGFTGTPVRDSERDTFNHYGPEDELYLHRYSIKEGIQDNLILPVVFTPRNEMEWEIDEDQLNVEFEQNFSNLDTEEKHEVIKNNVTTREIAELKPRVNAVTENIYEHFQSVDKNGFKGLVVTPSQKAAALYGERLQSLLSEEEVEVFVSAGEDSDDIVKQYKTTKEERDSIVEDYKKEDNPKIIVVCDMLLTGFDAPVLKTMYLDRNLKNHSLLQAIARTNRIKEGKNNGEIVDYQGVFQNLDKALDYSEEVRESAAINKDEMFKGSDEVQGFKPLLEDLITIFDGIEKSDSLEPLNKAVSRLRKNPDDRKRFKEGMRKLQDLYETLSPDKRLKHEEIAPKYKWLTQVRIAFETDEDGGRDDSEDNIREKTKEILEENVEITDIKEEFSSYKLSEEHLEEIENLEPNIKATKIITATHNHLDVHRGENPRYKRISERLNEVIERWQSEEVTDIEAVDKLEEIEREMIELEEAPEENDMKDYEYAFYTALTDNYSDYLSEEEAEGVARKLGEQFREKIDTDFENWYENEKVRKEFGKVIVDILLKEFDKKDLYLDNRETLIEDFWDYAVENTVNTE